MQHHQGSAADKPRPKSGFYGVSASGKKWTAKLHYDGKQHSALQLLKISLYRERDISQSFSFESIQSNLFRSSDSTVFPPGA
jgi:hypothetical protein